MLVWTIEETETINLPPLSVYDQSRLIRKVNLYFTLFKRPLWNPRGYCHGLTILWQQKMTDRLEKEYYATNKKIIQCPRVMLADLEDDVSVQKFIAQTEYAQNPEKYSAESTVRQIDVDRIQGTQSELFFKDWISLGSFIQLLEKHAKAMPAITVANFLSHHTMGIYFRDNQYHVFDSNYESGQAKIFDTPLQAATEAIDCTYHQFGLKPQQWMTDLALIFTKPMPSLIGTRKKSIINQAPLLFTPRKLNVSLEIQKEEQKSCKPL